LVEGDSLIGERIRTSEVFERVEAIVRVNRQHRCWTENVDITGREIKTVNELSLALAPAHDRIGWVSRSCFALSQIEVKRVLPVGTVIKALDKFAETPDRDTVNSGASENGRTFQTWR
jgi:hypothetical protein